MAAVDSFGPHGDRNPDTPAVLRAGIVLPKKHPTDPNLYYVHFKSKSLDQTGRIDGGVWCSNGISSYVRYRDGENKAISYGSYFPIHPYAPVNVLFSGRSNPVIIGYTKTPTSLPDLDNRDDLYVLGATPQGSTIELDDTTGAIRIMYKEGLSNVMLSKETISLELVEGGAGGKKLNTGIFLRHGGIQFKLPNSMMQFDETGLSVSFDDGGTFFRVTKNVFTAEGMDVFKIASKEQVSIKGSKTVIEGVKDMSVTGNELKLGGKQQLTMTAPAMTIESIFALLLKSEHDITLESLVTLTEKAALKESTILTAETKTIGGTFTGAFGSYNMVTGDFNVGSGGVNLDWNVKTNSGFGMKNSVKAYETVNKALLAIRVEQKVVGTLMSLKSGPISMITRTLTDVLGSTSEPAQEPSGSVSGARDKNDKKSYAATAAMKFSKNKFVMEKYTIVPPMLSYSAGTGDVGSNLTSSRLANPTGFTPYVEGGPIPASSYQLRPTQTPTKIELNQKLTRLFKK